MKNGTTDWWFADFPNDNVVNICIKAATEIEKIITEAETEFNIQL